jgi:hypothetical protein
MANPIITIPEGAKGALKLSAAQLEAAKRTDENIRREIEGRKLIAKVCQEQMRDMMFGVGKGPSFKQRCLQYASFNAIKTVWASEQFMERNRARAGN